jgi:hypothetical protein
MRGLLILLFSLWVQAAMAGGFATHDLTGLADVARTALGPDATAQVAPVHLRTSFAALEAICIQRNPGCRLSTLPAGRAIGWLSVYALDNGAGATAVILRDGDLLTIEAQAANRGAAEDSVRRLTQTVLPHIVGP